MLRSPPLMPGARPILHALRVAASWLLVVSVFFGPAGLGGSAAFAASAKPCGVSCPCDDAAPADEHAGEHAGEHEEHADPGPCDDDDGHAEPEHEAGDPCQDECPDDCPHCGCCLGVAMAVLSLPVISLPVSCCSARTLAPADTPASGACTGVFRPPRLPT